MYFFYRAYAGDRVQHALFSVVGNQRGRFGMILSDAHLNSFRGIIGTPFYLGTTEDALK
jgi:hypothetical protein